MDKVSEVDVFYLLDRISNPEKYLNENRVLLKHLSPSD